MQLIRITFATQAFHVFGMIIRPKGYVVLSDKLGSSVVCCLPRLVLAKYRNPRGIGMTAFDIRSALWRWSSSKIFMALLTSGFPLCGQVPGSWKNCSWEELEGKVGPLGSY